MNYLVATLMFLFVLFITAKGHLGQYVSLLTFTPAATGATGSTPAAASGGGGGANVFKIPDPLSAIPGLNMLQNFFGIGNAPK